MGGDARPVRLLGGGSVVLARLGGGEVRGRRGKGREKKGTCVRDEKRRVQVESTSLSGRA